MMLLVSMNLQNHTTLLSERCILMLMPGTNCCLFLSCINFILNRRQNQFTQWGEFADQLLCAILFESMLGQTFDFASAHYEDVKILEVGDH